MRFRKSHELAVTPIYETEGAAGMDLTATTKTVTKDYVEYGTGIHVEIPPLYVGLLFPRSSITKTDMTLKNCVGVIDSDFRGEITFRFQESSGYISRIANAISAAFLGYITGTYNTKLVDIALREEFVKIGSSQRIYKVGDRIGQLVIVPVERVSLQEVNKLSETARGSGGYGSTDIKK